jgi:hypothetical protein
VPTRDEHINRAEDNEQFIISLDLAKSINVDWAITILFYAALHYVDAYFAVQSIHPPDHTVRDNKVSVSLNAIYRDYRYLKDRSREARYNVPNFQISHYTKAHQRYATIKAHVLSKIR